MRNWLGPHVLDALAYVRPGCTLVTVHALVPQGLPRRGAAELAAALVTCAPAIVARGRFGVYDSEGGVARAAGGMITEAGGPATAPARQTASLPPLRPLALCSAAAGALVQSAAPARASGQLRVYMSGTLLQLAAGAGAVAGQLVQLQLPAMDGQEGVALVELDDGSGGDVPPVLQRLRPVLLTRDAAIAAEVASLADAWSSSSCGGSDDAAACAAAEAQAEAVVLAIGHALVPGAPAAVVRLAAGAAAQLRLPATLQALLPAVVAAGAPPAGHDTLLHAAVRSGDVDILAAVRGAGAVCGCAASVSDQGKTPLHAAASLRDAAVRERVLAALCDGDTSAPLAWCAARDVANRLPTQYAVSAGGAPAADAALRHRLEQAGRTASAALQRTQDELGIFLPDHAYEMTAAALSRAHGQAAADAIVLLRVLMQASSARVGAYAASASPAMQWNDAPAPAGGYPRRRWRRRVLQQGHQRARRAIQQRARLAPVAVARAPHAGIIR